MVRSRREQTGRWRGRAQPTSPRRLLARDTFTETSATALTSHVPDKPATRWVSVATTTQTPGMVSASDYVYNDFNNSNPRAALQVPLPRHGNFDIRITVTAFDNSLETRGIHVECYQGPAIGLGNDDQNRRWNLSTGYGNFLNDKFIYPFMGVGGDDRFVSFPGVPTVIELSVRRGRFATMRVIYNGSVFFWGTGVTHPATCWWPGVQQQNQGVIATNTIWWDDFEVYEVTGR